MPGVSVIPTKAGPMLGHVYEAMKRIAPRRFLVANETWIRRIVSWFYLGRARQCNLCGTRLSRFIRRPDDLMCPRCGSLGRTRRLFAILGMGYLTPGTTVLDFSPSRPLYRALKATSGIRYVASDYAGEFVADAHNDLTQLDLPSESVDLVICYHVLEHIENDRAAMSEIRRVLRVGGRALIQTPFKEGDILEDASITTAEGRRQRFGQEDHVRNYSVAGLVGRLEQAGLRVAVESFNAEPDNYHGWHAADVVLVAQRTTDS